MPLNASLISKFVNKRRKLAVSLVHTYFMILLKVLIALIIARCGKSIDTVPAIEKLFAVSMNSNYTDF